jgi:hypothetical protein
MTLVKLSRAKIAEVRAELLAAQKGRCALSGILIRPGQAVLDHDHSTGVIRAVLDRGVNALLGKVENNAARYGVRELAAFGNGLGAYLQRHVTPQTPWLHPLHKTPDEKRVRRNTLARKRRATKKDAT